MIETIKKYLTCPKSVLALSLLMSVIALSGAFTAQFALGLEPCILCLYQRIPFVIVIVLAMIGLMFKPVRVPIISLCALAFFANAGLAFYHHGVEQQWWVSAFEACAVPDSFLNPDSAGTESLLDQLLKTPSVPCNKIPWIDPVFEMSMAFWNIWFCAGMGMVCGFCIFFNTKLKKPH